MASASMARGACEPQAIIDICATTGCSAPSDTSMSLSGKHILVTAGPTHEPIDPIRVIANRSSGKQGFAIAAAAAEAGARVTLIAGPVCLDAPAGVTRVDVETAVEMQAAVEAALPADCAILVAAVAMGVVEVRRELRVGRTAKLTFKDNPDILAELSECPRPRC